MEEDTKRRLGEMSLEEQEKRFHELRKKLGLVEPMSISGGKPPLVASLAEHEEYQFLKKVLGVQL